MLAYRVCGLGLAALTLVSAVALPAFAQVSTEQALAPFQQFLRGLVAWMLGPGRLIIAGAWILAGFRVVLGMDRGAGPFVLVALVGFTIVFAPQILGALGIDVSPYI
ncbi:MAG: hypothetical protein AUH69_13255 [Actinobacteria bacterium 13_1_40CM_4_65_12]|nr:MAG: hypothetical protein AUH69_13255 [Actinobacteria bacterium 13_1_40CM_4_65_12]